MLKENMFSHYWWKQICCCYLDMSCYQTFDCEISWKRHHILWHTRVSKNSLRSHPKPNVH